MFIIIFCLRFVIISKSDDKSKQSIDEKMKQNMFKSGDCAVFEYNIGNEAQAKTSDGDRNFFQD